MKAWENSQKQWKQSPAARVSTAFFLLPNFHSFFYRKPENVFYFLIIYGRNKLRIYFLFLLPSKSTANQILYLDLVLLVCYVWSLLTYLKFACRRFSSARSSHGYFFILQLTIFQRNLSSCSCGRFLAFAALCCCFLRFITAALSVKSQIPIPTTTPCQKSSE